MSKYYPNQIQLFIDGQWCDATAGETLPVTSPVDDSHIASVARARAADLEKALEAAEKGIAIWRNTQQLERAKILRKASEILRSRAQQIAEIMSFEQGKILAESSAEVLRTADGNDWLAGEAERIYGRTIAGRTPNVHQQVVKDPIGIVAAFTPWNFPLFQMVRKTAGALAAGCSIVIKGPEESPACCAELIKAYQEAGVPAGVVNLVFGVPAEISEYLIPHPKVRKVSFTGSTPVGKHLASLAGENMKVITMELGGHAPVLVFDDAKNLDIVAQTICGTKFRNAGASCINPTRIMVQESSMAAFVEAFVNQAKKIVVGPSLEATTTMGPMCTDKRLAATAALVEDALANGAQLILGGQRIGTKGNFYEPTVLTNVPKTARIMNEEPFAPIAVINSFKDIDTGIKEANRLPYGLAAFGFTSDPLKARRLSAEIEAGMVAINHFGLGNPEAPFGGMKDSGFGFEGGSEAIEAYLQTRFISVADL